MDVPVDDNRLMLDDRDRFSHYGEVTRCATGGFPVGCYPQAQPTTMVQVSCRPPVLGSGQIGSKATSESGT